MTGASSRDPRSALVPPDQGGSSAPPDTAAVAVALEYDGSPDAPRVTASGRGWMAEQILALAFAHGVKVRQDADLVQILAALDIDSEIPPETFLAVAEILAYVYRANGNMETKTDGERATP